MELWEPAPHRAESRQDRSWVMSADHVWGHHQLAFSENDAPLLGGSGPVGRRPPIHRLASALTWYPAHTSWAAAADCSVENMWLLLAAPIRLSRATAGFKA